jgi:hypothetical protein
MNVGPRIARVALVGLALAGLAGPAFAAPAVSLPGNGGSIVLPAIALPSVLPPPGRDSLLPSDTYSGFDTFGQKFGVQNGRLDFFSMRPDDGGTFKPLLRGGVGDGGLQLQLKW